MLGRSTFSRTRGFTFRPENLAQIRNLCLTLFALGVLIFTIIAVTYDPDSPLFHPSTKITTYLTSNSNAVFKSDNSVIKTGEDVFYNFLNATDVELTNAAADESRPKDCKGPIDCKDRELFHLMMEKAIEQFKDIHFSRFGKPAFGGNESTCDMAWRFRPKDGKADGFYKDYRRFLIARSEHCTLSVLRIGDYHSGVNARKRKKYQTPSMSVEAGSSLPAVGSESLFRRGKYLLYHGGGDRCKNMNHFLWSFLCALGEAQYLNRTLVMDMTLCLNSMYTSSNQDEEGKDFRFYFDLEHLNEAASVLDQAQFWEDWDKWQQKNGLNLHLVEDIRVTPMKLKVIKDTLIMRKFGFVEPDNYWYRVCEGEAESVVQRPWNLIWKSRRLMDIVSTITSRLNGDYDTVHIERGDKASNKELWPNLAVDTSPDTLLTALATKIEDGRSVYIATNEPDISFFEPLKEKYTQHFLDEYKHLWDESSEWYLETTKLNKGVPVEFDGYMRLSVDAEVFLRGKRKIETFNDLTHDCKDGINTCSAAAS